MLLRDRPGINWDLEEQATALLKKDRKDRGLKRYSDLNDWLTEDQFNLRLDREVYNSLGFPDPEILVGTFIRAWNPLFGTRPKRLAEAV